MNYDTSRMKLLITLIDWEYPEQRIQMRPEIWNLSDKDDLFALYMSLANCFIKSAWHPRMKRSGIVLERPFHMPPSSFPDRQRLIPA
jgi:hypothetical protein